VTRHDCRERNVRNSLQVLSHDNRAVIVSVVGPILRDNHVGVELHRVVSLASLLDSQGANHAGDGPRTAVVPGVADGNSHSGILVERTERPVGTLVDQLGNRLAVTFAFHDAAGNQETSLEDLDAGTLVVAGIDGADDIAAESFLKGEALGGGRHCKLFECGVQVTCSSVVFESLRFWMVSSLTFIESPKCDLSERSQ